MKTLTQTPRLIDTVNIVAQKINCPLQEDYRLATKQELLPGKGRLIQTIIEKPIGDSILPSEACVEQEIGSIHAQGEAAYLILTAPIVPQTNSAKDNFLSASDDGYRYYAVTLKELEAKGLADTVAVRKEANSLRDAAKVAITESKMRARTLVA